MGQTVAVPSTQPCSRCHEWGAQDYNTVRVDITKLNFSDFSSPGAKEDAENHPPQNSHKTERTIEEEKRILEEAWERETERRHQEWEAKQRRLSHQRQLLEQEQQEQKRQQLILQAEAIRRQTEEEQQKKKEMEELRLKQLRHKEEEEEEGHHQETKQEVEEAKRKQLEQEEEDRKSKLEASQKVQSWLKDHGFAHLNELQRNRFAKVRPLHVAVQGCDVENVTLLLKAGADRNLTNSKRETPLQLALRLNKGGSHSDVMSVLSDQTASH